MKLKIFLISLIIVWGTGCIAYVQHPNQVQVDIRPSRTVVRVTTPPVVHHVHRTTRTRTVHVHHHHRTRTVTRHSRHHHRTRANRRNNNRRHHHHRHHHRHRRH